MESGFSSFPREGFNDFVRKLESDTALLPRQEARLAQYMLLNLNSLGLETGKSLAAKVGVSEVTVGRMLRRLGCAGMKGLKLMLRQHHSITSISFNADGPVPTSHEGTLEAELNAIRSVFRQTEEPNWQVISQLLTGSSSVYVSGFQSVRGVAEDFSRRLALARDNVHFLSAHDGMLGEWLGSSKQASEGSCLVLIDVVPYASEAQELARLAKRQHRSCIVISDEFCHWSKDISDACLYAPSRTGLFLESTVGIVAALNLMVDAVAKANPQATARRLVEWKKNAKRLGLF